MKKIFKKYEKKLRLKNVKGRYLTRNGAPKRLTEDDRKFKVPTHPQKGVTLQWKIVVPSEEDKNVISRDYMVKYTIHNNIRKKEKIPKRMWNQRRQFQIRRDARIALADATFTSEKREVNPCYEYQESNNPELTEKELRKMDEYASFFEDWDDGDFDEDDCIEVMMESINKRVAVYEDVYKQSGNMFFLAKGVFLKQLDLNSISELHKMYLMLAEECGLPMCYVEGILRRHYE